MRKPSAISPSAFFLYKENKKKYYIRYMSDKEELKVPSSYAMSVGSAFDAYAKAALDADLQLGNVNLDQMFENQVEEPMRDRCRKDAIYLLSEYKKQGAYAVLLKDLEQAQIMPMFEFNIQGTLNGVPVKGFPDGFYINAQGKHCVIDWKVNGYENGTGKPKKYYTASYPKRVAHKNTLVNSDGVNTTQTFEKVDQKWAFQQMIYALALGAEDGYICTLEQVVGREFGIGFYTYKAPIDPEWQKRNLAELFDMWEKVQAGNIFGEDNEKIIADLDGIGRLLM